MSLAFVGLCGVVAYIAIAFGLTALLGQHFRRRSGNYRHRHEDSLAEANDVLALGEWVRPQVLESRFHDQG